MNDKSPFRLTWNQVGQQEWQAGGGARYYSIMQDGERFTVTLCDQDTRVRSVASESSLDAAKAAAEGDFCAGKPDAIVGDRFVDFKTAGGFRG